jgi:hypothetical protein
MNADEVGERLAAWMDDKDWVALNDGAATRHSYGTGSGSAPDVVLCAPVPARRCIWWLGEDLGIDHLPLMTKVRMDMRAPRRIRKTRWAFHKAD